MVSTGDGKNGHWMNYWKKKNYIFRNPTTNEIRLASLNIIIHKTRKHQRLSTIQSIKRAPNIQQYLTYFQWTETFLDCKQILQRYFIFLFFAQARKKTYFMPTYWVELQSFIHVIKLHNIRKRDGLNTFFIESW